jgi:Flp pilus assembly protein TadG
MRAYRKFRSLWREEKGVAAAAMVVFLTGMVGVSALAVDLGVAYTAKAQLHNAADSAALAAADTMLGVGPNNNAVAQPGVALSTAVQFSSLNQAIGVNAALKNPPGADFTIGYWDSSKGAFDQNRTGLGLSNPNDLTAVSVKIRRDTQANTPVSTYFARIVGVEHINVSASSTAFRGFPEKVPAGTVDLPIAVLASAINGDDGPNCGQSLTFHSNGDQNAEWTTFFTWPANDPNVDAYVNGTLPIPALAIGDQIDLTNGNLSNGTFNDLAARFNAEQTNGQWQVTLPVIAAPGMGANLGAVAGFCTFVITEVNLAPSKDLSGFLKCGVVIPSTPTGGGNYGSRASSSKLIY